MSRGSLVGHPVPRLFPAVSEYTIRIVDSFRAISDFGLRVEVSEGRRSGPIEDCPAFSGIPSAGGTDFRLESAKADFVLWQPSVSTVGVVRGVFVISPGASR